MMEYKIWSISELHKAFNWSKAKVVTGHWVTGCRPNCTTSCFHILGPMGQTVTQHYVSSSSPGGGNSPTLDSVILGRVLLMAVPGTNLPFSLLLISI